MTQASAFTKLWLSRSHGSVMPLLFLLTHVACQLHGAPTNLFGVSYFILLCCLVCYYCHGPWALYRAHAHVLLLC